MHYPNYYDPLYYPECYPELFATPFSVKMWLEHSLCSHISCCCSCSSKHHFRKVNFSVQWKNPLYVICSYVDGNLKQCTLSLRTLQSKKYSHCQIVSKLCRTSFVVPPSAKHNIDVYSVMAEKEPAWLFYSDNLYRLHLSQLHGSVLSSAVKSCSETEVKSPQEVSRYKTAFISKIIDHFVSQRSNFISAVRNGIIIFSQDILCTFVEQTERLYGASVAALLRERMNPHFCLVLASYKDLHFLMVCSGFTILSTN